MADPAAIRQAIADNCESITGVQWSAYILSNPTPPTGMVGLFRVPDEDTTFQRGKQRYEVDVRVYVGTATDIGAQKQLDPFLMGSAALKPNLETDKTLGGLVDDLRVTDTRPAQFVEGGSRQGGRMMYLGCEWTVEFLVSNPDV